MATPYQPLLIVTPKHNPIISCKIFFFVIAFIVSVAFLVTPYQINVNNHSGLLSVPSSRLCDTAYDSKACLSFVSEVLVSDGIVTSDSDNLDLLKKFLVNYVHHMNSSIPVVHKIKNRINNNRQQGALADCLELLDLSIDAATDSIAALGSPTSRLVHADAQIWLSGVLTNHVTCLDGLDSVGNNTSIKSILENLISRARAALAMLASVTDSNEEFFFSTRGMLPLWVKSRDRKLLQSSGKDIEADAVVAQDGTGDYETLSEAVDAAPNKSKTRYVIYVKEGIYQENVDVGKKKINLMIVGDGMNSTIITGSLNIVDGTSTFHSATLAAVGKGFILQDICIQNTAGPEKHQAVALRVGADLSVINRCRIDAYQDTLYAHSYRQFYTDCYVTGTVDFIFGNAAVVLQKCQLVPRKPMQYQKNMVTAQGRTDPNQATGTSIQFCDIIASPDLEPVQSEFPTYLGRPWKNYSRTAVMESYLGDLIDPSGWAEWNGDPDWALKTLEYREFMNSGPGAGTSKRVDWPGYQVITDPAEALPFTVAELINGGAWLSSTGVAYVEGLYEY